MFADLDIQELPKPLYCCWCNNFARYLINDTSACLEHKGAAIVRARELLSREK